VNLPVGSEVCSPAGYRRTSKWQCGRKTGGQAAIQGCEVTVVLPPHLHSVSHPPLGQGLREQVLKSPLVCGGTGQESGEGLVCSSTRPRGHISVRGSFHLMFSNCTARGLLRAPGPLYLQQALTHKCSKRLGPGKKGALPSRKPVSWLLSCIPWWAPQSEAQDI